MDDNCLGSIFLDYSIFTDDNSLDSIFLDETSKRRLNYDAESGIFLTETETLSIQHIPDQEPPDSLVLTDNSPDIVFFSRSSLVNIFLTESSPYRTFPMHALWKE